jgi:hypothetical protein
MEKPDFSLLFEGAPVSFIFHPYYSKESLCSWVHSREPGIFEMGFSDILHGRCFQPVTESMRITLRLDKISSATNNLETTFDDIFSRKPPFGDYVPLDCIVRYANEIIDAYKVCPLSGGLETPHHGESVMIKIKPLPNPDDYPVIPVMKKVDHRFSFFETFAKFDGHEVRFLTGSCEPLYV